MTLILRIFITMKYLLTIILFFTCVLNAYTQNMYDVDEYYEVRKITRDTLYNSNGSILQIGQASFNLQGQKHGDWLVWDGNSQLRAQMFYENGVRKGEWKIYDEHGNLVNSRIY